MLHRDLYQEQPPKIGGNHLQNTMKLEETKAAKCVEKHYETWNMQQPLFLLNLCTWATKLLSDSFYVAIELISMLTT